jgi:hypothetical protein
MRESRDAHTHLLWTPKCSFGLGLFDEIHFILEDDKMLQLHDLHGRQVLGCLWLRTRLVRSDEKKRGVHHRSAVQHRSHEGIVPGAIDERDIAYELHPVTTPRPLVRQVVLLVGAVRSVVPWPWAGFVLAFVDLPDVGVDRRLRLVGERTFAFAYLTLIVMFRTSSFLKPTVITPEMAFTTVDFTCAT